MRIRRIVFTLVVWTGISALVELSQAQTPARSATPVAAKSGAAAGVPKTQATLAQLMKGILFPNSNVIFFAQGEDPAKVPPAKDPAAATDPLADTYGKWEAVENSALAIAESANLLTIPGRKCSNGLAVPIGNADWPKLVQGLRDAGMAAYKAAQSKNMDKILDAADVMTTACSNCHDKYREKPTPAGRCK
jgi:cytochrome c556